MRLFIVYLWSYIRVLLYGKLFKKKCVSERPTKNPLNKECTNNTPSNKSPYLTYKRNNVGDLSNTPSHKKRIKNRNNRKRRRKNT